MYAVIRRYRLAEGASVAEVMRRVHRGFVPIVSGVAGFSAYHAVDLGGGEVLSVGVFEGRDAAEESTRRAAEWVEENLAELVAGPPDVEVGEVGAHAVKGGGEGAHLDSGQPV
jgi:hypothetical protein